MFLEILDMLNRLDSGFNVLHYLTVRAIFAVMSALAVSLIFGRYMIKKLSYYQIRQSIRTYGPKGHLEKSGTPTMGGLLILFSFIMSLLIWGNWQSTYIWIIVFTALIFGAIGFIDDVLKIKHKNSFGLSAKQKYTAQSVAALIIAYWLFLLTDNGHQIIIPFIKNTEYILGLWSFLLLAYFIIVGSSNAVNLTDGLDGLAIMPVILIAGTFAIFAYLSGNYNFAHYLNIPFLAHAGEIVIVCSALIGSSLGFLWFNSYPANIFMGDVGSISLGALLAVIAISLHQELLFFIIGGVFVIETLSVILQVGSYKLRGGRRIFLMAPLHHHFEQKGWSEPKIIVRFWMITLILVLIGLSSLKIR